MVIVGEQFVGKSAIFLRQQKGLFEPEKSTASMGAHFAQKIVEIESEVSRSFKNSLHHSTTNIDQFNAS